MLLRLCCSEVSTQGRVDVAEIHHKNNTWHGLFIIYTFLRWVLTCAHIASTERPRVGSLRYEVHLATTKIVRST